MDRKIIAILRGIKPVEVRTIAHELIIAGITKIEVPLNSPDPLKSVEILVREFAETAQLGAGTVLTLDQVKEVAQTGAHFIVSPNCDPQIICATKSAKLNSFPGAFTPSECFSALKNGADGIKIFPAFQMGQSGLNALRAVLPTPAQIYAVGGLEPANFRAWARAGANGFGLGSCLYKPGMTARDVRQNADAAVKAYDAAFAK